MEGEYQLPQVVTDHGTYKHLCVHTIMMKDKFLKAKINKLTFSDCGGIGMLQVQNLITIYFGLSLAPFNKPPIPTSVSELSLWLSGEMLSNH